MLIVYGLEMLYSNPAALFESGYLAKGHLFMIVEAYKHQIAEVRKQAIPLIEAFDLNPISNVGNFYGDIFETQLEWARTSRLNTGKPLKGFEHFQNVLKSKL